MTTLVCLPGLLCEPEVFDPMRAVLPQQEGAPVDMRVLPLPGGDDFAALARSLAADIPDGAVLLGMSMGSYLALRVALTHPGKLAGLVLIGTNAAADTPDAAAMRGKEPAGRKRPCESGSSAWRWRRAWRGSPSIRKPWPRAPISVRPWAD